jgi:hypothetical protein
MVPLNKENSMLSKSRFLKSTVIAALVGLAGVAAVTPASARDYDGDRTAYHRDSGWGRDHDRYDRHDRDDRGWYWRHHRHHFHGWY